MYKLKRKNYQNISNDSLLYFSGFSLGSVHSFGFSKDKEAGVRQYPSTSFIFIWNMMARCAKCGCLFVFLAVVCCFTTTLCRKIILLVSLVLFNTVASEELGGNRSFKINMSAQHKTLFYSTSANKLPKLKIGFRISAIYFLQPSKDQEMSRNSQNSLDA